MYNKVVAVKSFGEQQRSNECIIRCIVGGSGQVFRLITGRQTAQRRHVTYTLNTGLSSQRTAHVTQRVTHDVSSAVGAFRNQLSDEFSIIAIGIISNVHEMYTTSMICLLSLPIAMTLSIHKTKNILQSSYSKHSPLLKPFISRISYVKTSKPNIILFTNCSNASSPLRNVSMVASYQYRGQRDRYHC